MNQKNSKNNVGHPRKGFTLVEAVVAVFIFSLTMISIVSIFSKFIIVQKRSRAIQQNMEDAKYALELMTKTIRTSSISSFSNTQVSIYDYSQDKCIIYQYNQAAKKIQSGSMAPGTSGNKATCNFALITTSPIVYNTISQMSIGVDQTVIGTKVGLVTISMEICSDPACSGSGNDRASLQTTVSLRDYEDTSL